MKPKACLYSPTSSRRPGRFKVSDATDSALACLDRDQPGNERSRRETKTKTPDYYNVPSYWIFRERDSRALDRVRAWGSGSQRWLHGWPPPRLRSRGPPPDLGSEPGVQAQTLALRSARRRPLLLADCVFIQIPKTHTSRSRPSNRMNPTNETHPS